MKTVTVVNSTTDTLKNYCRAKREDRQSLV